MSESGDRKRELSSPEPAPSQGKAIRTGDQDISIIPLTEINAAQPAVKILSPSKLQSISLTTRGEDDKTYQLFLKLERRVCKQELEIRELRQQVEHKNQVIKDFNNLKQ